MKEVKEVVHVPTRELAEEVLRVAKENGLYEFTTSLDEMIRDSGSLLDMSFYSLSHYKEKKYKIITAEEFLNRYEKDEVSELDQLRKENAELKQQLKAIEDQPKVGDVCLFWDGDMNSYLVSVLKTVHLDNEYPFKNENGLSYNYCIKATDENIQAKIKELKND